MSLSKLLAQSSATQRQAHHANSTPGNKLQPTSYNSHQILPPRKASIPVHSSPVKHASKRRPSRQPAAKEANLSSDDDDPTLHDLSISKSLALERSSVPKMKQTAHAQTLHATSLKSQVFAQTQKMMKSTQSLSLTRQVNNRNGDPKPIAFAKPPMHDLTTGSTLPTPHASSATKSSRLPHSSQKQSPHPSLYQKQPVTQRTPASVEHKTGKVASKQKSNQIEITTAHQLATKRKQSVPHKPKVLEFMTPKQQVQKSTRSVTNNSHLDNRQQNDLTTVSVGSAASAPHLLAGSKAIPKQTSPQLSIANQELMKLFRLLESDIADIDDFPYLQQLIKSEAQNNKMAGGLYPKAVNQFDKQYQNLLQSGTVYQTPQSQQKPGRRQDPHNVDCESTDEYLKVDEAPQRIRNSSVQKTVPVTPSLKSKTPKSPGLRLPQPGLNVIQKNKQLLGQLNLVRIRLKKTVDDYQHQIGKVAHL